MPRKTPKAPKVKPNKPVKVPKPAGTRGPGPGPGRRVGPPAAPRKGLGGRKVGPRSK